MNLSSPAALAVEKLGGKSRPFFFFFTGSFTAAFRAFLGGDGRESGSGGQHNRISASAREAEWAGCRESPPWDLFTNLGCVYMTMDEAMRRCEWGAHKVRIVGAPKLSLVAPSTARGEGPHRPCSPRLWLTLGGGVAGRLPPFRRCSQKRIWRN